MQRQIRDSRIVQRAAARGIDLYLGFFAANPANSSTPYVDWFDDAGWARTAERMGDFAGAARMLGFRGIAIDQELYGGKARWTWNYPGNIHTEAQVRAKAKQRGRQAMAAILDGFPLASRSGRTTSCKRTRGSNGSTKRRAAAPIQAHRRPMHLRHAWTSISGTG